MIDPAKQLMDRDPTRNVWINDRGKLLVPPSGHVAGVYARVDEQRGVHKAPANEALFGSTNVKYYISKRHQALLNPQGVNCIRNINGNITVYGGRTVGGDRNGEWKYVNVRRVMLFLKESIDEGTQWVVFEPNDPVAVGQDSPQRQRLPHPRVEERRAVRPHAAGGVLRQVRRGNQSAGGPRRRSGRRRSGRRHRAARGIRDLPRHAVDWSGQVVGSGKRADGQLDCTRGRDRAESGAGRLYSLRRPGPRRGISNRSACVHRAPALWPVRESRRGVQIHRLSVWEDFALEVGKPPPEGSF